jgi:hypothetical protein
LTRKQAADGWLVLDLGADHDAWAQASAMGLRAVRSGPVWDRGRVLQALRHGARCGKQGGVGRFHRGRAPLQWAAAARRV